MDIKEKVSKLPDCPGVYIMKSKHKKVLYVGKASSLHKRVRSYFSKHNSFKTDALMENVFDVDYIECQSPEQALILEAALIKEKKPKYNISLRDNKSYPYIEITNEKFPRIFITRPKNKTKSLLFGPYPKVKPLKPALNMIRRVFPYCSCNDKPKTPCFYYHLKLCPAPFAGKISVAGYKENIDNISKILKGQRKQLVKKLKKKMFELSKLKKFEEAAATRDKIVAIENLYKGKPREHEILSLKETLNLKKIPLVIEAVDISSLAGGDAVGSVVVFKDGIADKNNYRRFRIKTIEGPDDYAMIAEVIERRYSRLVKEKKTLPDLIVVDGGKGHVVKAFEVLKKLGIKIEIIGIAKENEEIWFPHKTKPLIIGRDKPCLHLIQRLRDEAHRFAHSYQLIRRRMKLKVSKDKRN